MENNGNNKKRRILVSACLIGEHVRYDATNKLIGDGVFQQWKEEGRLVPICPEVAGGLLVPRPPAEIQMGNGQDVIAGLARVKTAQSDVTLQFLEGAQQTLALAQRECVVMAVLKARSPSCGSKFIYDGTFSGRTKAGSGVAAALLKAHGILVFSETTLDEAARYLADCEQSLNPAPKCRDISPINAA